MKIKVNFHGVFSKVFQKDEIKIELEEAANIGALLKLLCDSDESRQNIFDQHGEIRRTVNIFKNGCHIDSFSGSQTILNEGDEIAILQLICGG